MRCACGNERRTASVQPLDGLGVLHSIDDCTDAVSVRAAIGASDGLENDALRQTAWPLLLGMPSWDGNGAERERKFAAFVSRAGEVDPKLVTVIDHDVPRTDHDAGVPLRALLLAQCVAEPQWGYFQGMSDIAAVAASVAGASRDADAFGLLRAILRESADNWASTELAGVWRQARAVRDVVSAADGKLGRRLASLETHGAERPLAFLFAPIFLRLKRELGGGEQAKRCWEVSWAIGGHFHVLCLAAFVLTQRALVLKRGVGVGEVHMIFGRAEAKAAPLLRAARRLRARPAVRAALERAMVSSMCDEPTATPGHPGQLRPVAQTGVAGGVGGAAAV